MRRVQAKGVSAEAGHHPDGHTGVAMRQMPKAKATTLIRLFVCWLIGHKPVALAYGWFRIYVVCRRCHRVLQDEGGVLADTTVMDR